MVDNTSDPNATTMAPLPSVEFALVAFIGCASFQYQFFGLDFLATGMSLSAHYAELTRGTHWPLFIIVSGLAGFLIWLAFGRRAPAFGTVLLFLLALAAAMIAMLRLSPDARFLGNIMLPAAGLPGLVTYALMTGLSVCMAQLMVQSNHFGWLYCYAAATLIYFVTNAGGLIGLHLVATLFMAGLFLTMIVLYEAAFVGFAGDLLSLFSQELRPRRTKDARS